MTVMYQLTLIGHDIHRERLARAEAQRPAGRLCALARATRRAERAERRLGRAAARPGGWAPSSRPRPPTTSDRPPRTAGNINLSDHQEVPMNRTRPFRPFRSGRRLARFLVALATALLTAAAAAPAAFAVPVPPQAAATGACYQRPRCRPSSSAACPAGRSRSSP
jgi:hypothetical protein